MNSKGDNNSQFITKYLSKFVKKNSHSIDQAVKRIQDLQQDQKIEWAHILALKAKSLLEQQGRTANQDLIQTTLVLVLVANKLACPYDTSSIQYVLKEIYIRENDGKLTNAQIVKAFKSCNFDCAEYQLFIYEDPWYSKLYRFFAD